MTVIALTSHRHHHPHLCVCERPQEGEDAPHPPQDEGQPGGVGMDHDRLGADVDAPAYDETWGGKR